MPDEDPKEAAEFVACAILDLIEEHGVPGVDELIEELLSDSEAPYAMGCLMHFAYWLETKIRQGPSCEHCHNTLPGHRPSCPAGGSGNPSGRG